MRIVLDTNQFVSALIRKEGHPAQILQAWREGKIDIAVSPNLLEEVYEVLNRPRIKRKYHLTTEDIEGYLMLLQKYALMMPGMLEVNVLVEDTDDNVIIACAVEAEADYIVSGDHHLLNLREYQDIRIIRASEFLQILDG
jgi:putative PIN family toxin of toxin-antitoxin system